MLGRQWLAGGRTAGCAHGLAQEGRTSRFETICVSTMLHEERLLGELLVAKGALSGCVIAPPAIPLAWRCCRHPQSIDRRGTPAERVDQPGW
jgi:hypothetical protein